MASDGKDDVLNVEFTMLEFGHNSARGVIHVVIWLSGVFVGACFVDGADVVVCHSGRVSAVGVLCRDGPLYSARLFSIFVELVEVRPPI